MISSISIMSLSWLFLILVIILVIPLLLTASAEERYCLKTYGKEYRDYIERTPRWIGIPKKKEKIVDDEANIDNIDKTILKN